jgi:homoaconitate hydratase
LVSGENFGTGSSREQACTALKYSNISLVVVASASETFKRNAVNNGLLILECPTLANRLVAIAKKESKNVRRLSSNWSINADLARGYIELVENGKPSEKFALSKVGPAVQELIMAGTLEQWVKKRIQT